MKKKINLVKIVGLVKHEPKPKVVPTHNVVETIEIRVMAHAEPKMISIPLIIQEEITVDDIYKKLKEKNKKPEAQTKINIPIIKKNKLDIKDIRLESSLKDTNLKEDVIFKIKIKKDFKNIWAPLDNDKVKSFLNFCRSILSKGNLEFKVSNKIIETLKMFSYIKSSEDPRLEKYSIPDDIMSDILCVRIYEETIKIQKAQLLDCYIIIPTFKTYTYGKYIKDLYQDYVNIKYDIYQLNATPYDLERKTNDVIKWLLFDSDICIEVLLEKALEHYLNEKIKENTKNNSITIKGSLSSIVLGMLLHIKNSAMILYKFRSNLENSFMENRIRRIRNILSRGESNLFHLKLEDTIKIVMDNIRSNKSTIRFSHVRELDIFDTLIEIENGERLNSFIKHKAKGKYNVN